MRSDEDAPGPVRVSCDERTPPRRVTFESEEFLHFTAYIDLREYWRWNLEGTRTVASPSSLDGRKRD